MRPKLPAHYPPLITLYRFYAKAYGWTPQQVGELSITQLEWFPLIEEAVNQAQEEIQEIVNNRSR
jgi:hypothetical protein